MPDHRIYRLDMTHPVWIAPGMVAGTAAIGHTIIGFWVASLWGSWFVPFAGTVSGFRSPLGTTGGG